MLSLSLIILFSPLCVRFELLVRVSTAAPAPADREAEHEQEERHHPDQGADPDPPGHLLPHRDVGPVHLLPVLVLQPQDVVLGGGLVDAQDVQGGDVAVVHGAPPLLLHSEHVVTGARHQGQLGLHALNLPGLLGQRRPTELHLDLGVSALDEEEMFVVVRVDPGRAVDSEGDRLTAGGCDDVLHLTEVLHLVLVAHLLQHHFGLVADALRPPGAQQ